MPPNMSQHLSAQPLTATVRDNRQIPYLRPAGGRPSEYGAADGLSVPESGEQSAGSQVFHDLFFARIGLEQQR